jgi:hypothetical protein
MAVVGKREREAREREREREKTSKCLSFKVSLPKQEKD